MAKDPALLWYPGDWVSGTQGMTFEEKGAYMELLMMQFNRGHMTDHMIAQEVGQLWGQINHKFLQDTEGFWYNERLDLEKNKRKSFTFSRRNNLEGKNQYSKTGHMDNHMENENININKNGRYKLNGGVGENKKGVRFDENFDKVFFDDGSWQSLGSEQKILAEGGDISPVTIIQGSIY